jgi:hypothetical protein
MHLRTHARIQDIKHVEAEYTMTSVHLIWLETGTLSAAKTMKYPTNTCVTNSLHIHTRTTGTKNKEFYTFTQMLSTVASTN